MDKVVAVVFNDEKQAYEGLRAFRDLHADGSITLYSNAVVAKDPNGKVVVRETSESPEGTIFGLLTGSLIGILGGPLGVAVGASTGTVIGATFDVARAGISDDFVEEMSEYLLPGKTAVITEIDGIVKYGDIAKGQRKIQVINENGVEREYSLPRGVHVNVQEGEHVRAGEPLMD